MTLDEKLDVFYNAAIEDATKQSIQIIDEYKQNLDKLFEEHKEEAKRKAEYTLKTESDYLVRDKNKRISDESLLLRREVTERVNEYEKLIFENVEKKLSEYMKTPAYTDLLQKLIKNALDFAKGEDLTIYINETDSDKKDALEQATNSTLTMSKEDFIGGTRAVLHARNILIDNSFANKLAEEKDSFTLK